MIKRPAITLMFSAALVLGISAGAGAQDCSASPLPDGCVPVGVLPQQPTSPSGGGGGTAAPAPGVLAVSPKQTLPVTGAETTALALGGLVLVATGGALVWRSNKAAA